VDQDLAEQPWFDRDGRGYALGTRRCVDGKRRTVYAHQIVFHRAHGWLPALVDHEDRNPANCRRDNLRPASRSQQNQNRRGKAKSTSRFKGVWRLGPKWQSQIQVNGKRIYLGLFASEEDAARAYNDAAVKHFGKFAFVNPLA
jgi:hypothetical protein